MMIRKVFQFGIALAFFGIILSFIMDKFGYGQWGGVVIVVGVLVYVSFGTILALTYFAKILMKR
jgi:hypothetical protein